MTRILALGLFCLTLMGGCFAFHGKARAGGEVPLPKEVDGSKVALSVTIKSKEAGYKVPARWTHWRKKAKSEEVFIRDAIAEIRAAGEIDRVMEPPTVDLEITIKNIGDKDIDLWTAGDSVQILWYLEGKGSHTAVSPLRIAGDVKPNISKKLKAGESHTTGYRTLYGGFRGISHQSHWLLPGEYELSATILTGVSPNTYRVQDREGFALTRLQSNTIKVKVTE